MIYRYYQVRPCNNCRHRDPDSLSGVAIQNNVIPAKAGIYLEMDPCLHRDDSVDTGLPRFEYETRNDKRIKLI